MWLFREKIMFFEKRKMLKGSEIVMGDEYTEREREIQKILKKKAEEARRNDPDIMIKVGYGKIKIGDKWLVWDEKHKSLFRKKGK